MRALLADEPDLAGLLAEPVLDEVFDPAGYLGESAALTQRAVTEARKWLGASLSRAPAAPRR